jgi:2-polyprenyl-3-methyl-5-hydroxy-6-metoxy-1,4-benzoquinol methylase
MGKCNLCQSSKIETIYFGKIRNGKFGNYIEDSNILECSSCGIIYLSNHKHDKSFYETSEYRESYNLEYDKKSYIKEVSGDNEVRLSKIRIQNILDKVVIDVGAGPGIFLDLLKPFSKKTIAIEPAHFYHDELKENHLVYSYNKDALEANVKGDIITSFNVIEHVEDPQSFLGDIHNLLNKSGKLIMITPNHDDILMKLDIPEFNSFYYRTAHLYYFNKQSITRILNNAGFKNIKVEYFHNLDISNLLIWAKDKTPSGLNFISLFNNNINEIYKKYIEEEGKSNYLWIEAEK